MPRIEVDTGGLSGGAQTQQQIAGDIAAAIGVLQNAAGSAAGASGEPGPSAAAQHLGDAFGGHLTALSNAVAGLAGNVASASSAYTTTDSTAMPGAPR